MSRSVVMVGPFPPPMHGMGAVNEAMRIRFGAAGWVPRVIDIAAPSLERGYKYHLVRFARVAKGVLRLLMMRAVATLYISASGGAGKIYEALFVAIARAKGMNVLVHHHSFAYLDRRSFLAWVLIRIGSQKARHIVLSEGMKWKLEKMYAVTGAISLSNAAFLSTRCGQQDPRESLKVLGFLSNISEEKGIFEFLDLVFYCRDVGLPVQALIAGPFQDVSTESRVRSLIAGEELVQYVGPKYGEDKDKFYDSIDVLVFPTRYVNEAEPVTIHEALMHGVPVIAYGRGAISEVIDGVHGSVIAPSVSFTPAAYAQVHEWTSNPASYELASKAAREKFRELRTRAATVLSNLTSLGPQ